MKLFLAALFLVSLTSVQAQVLKDAKGEIIDRYAGDASFNKTIVVSKIIEESSGGFNYATLGTENTSQSFYYQCNEDGNDHDNGSYLKNGEMIYAFYSAEACLGIKAEVISHLKNNKKVAFVIGQNVQSKTGVVKEVILK